MEPFNRKKQHYDAPPIFKNDFQTMPFEYNREDAYQRTGRKYIPNSIKSKTDDWFTTSCGADDTLRLPSINPNKKFLITQDESSTSYKAYRNSQVLHETNRQRNPVLLSRQTQRRSCSSDYLPFDSNNNGGQRTGRIRPRHSGDLLLSSSLATKLKSGTVHYRNILPPIGETYSVRAKEYYSDVIEDSRVSSPNSIESESTDHINWESREWLEDFFETMRRYFTGQDQVLEEFLSSASAGRRSATCEVLDVNNDQLGAIEYMRHKLIGEVLAMYF